MAYFTSQRVEEEEEEEKKKEEGTKTSYWCYA